MKGFLFFLLISSLIQFCLIDNNHLYAGPDKTSTNKSIVPQGKAQQAKSWFLKGLNNDIASMYRPTSSDIDKLKSIYKFPKDYILGSSIVFKMG